MINVKNSVFIYKGLIWMFLLIGILKINDMIVVKNVTKCMKGGYDVIIFVA